MIRVFRFLKDVQHEPRAQMAGHSKGEILMTGHDRGLSVSRRGDEVSLVTGHGTSDEFRVGVEVEELTETEAQRHIREAALARLSPDERAAFQQPGAPSARNAGDVLREAREEFLQESGY